MMSLARWLAAGAMAAILQPSPATAEPQSLPNGPWVLPQQEVSLSAIRTYDELLATLENIVQSSQGAARLDFAPYAAKGSGRLVPYVSIGSGPRKMLVVSQQHGHEFITSNGMIALIRALSSGARDARFIRNELTLLVVPRVNVDGFDATPAGEPWRYNVDPLACTGWICPPFYVRNQGYDVNRYHPYLTAYPLDDPNTLPADGANPVPESLNVRALYDMAGGAAAVEVVIDLHGQETPLDADGDMVTVSTLWPTAVSTSNAMGSRARFDAAVVRSKQVIATAIGAWNEIAHANATRYVGGDHPGIARNAYGLLGSASVLMEHRTVGQKAAGYMANISFRAVLAVVQALADGRLYTTDIAPAEALVAAADSASLVWKCVVAGPNSLERYDFCFEKYGQE